MTVPTILDDQRPIKSITIRGEQDVIWNVGEPEPLVNVTRIEAYSENGIYGHATWFAVYVDDVLQFRVPAYMCEVFYCRPNELQVDFNLPTSPTTKLPRLDNPEVRSQAFNKAVDELHRREEVR